MTAEEQKVIDDAAAAKALADKKVEFTEEQQTAIGKLFDKRFATISSKHDAEKKTLAEETAALKAELEELKAGKPAKKEGDEDPKEAQYKDLLKNEKSQTKAAKDALEASKSEATGLQKENLRIRKEVAIRESAGNRFLDMEVVMAMVSEKIEYDADSKTFVIREAGVVRQNSSLQNMTLAEYFEEFGKKRPYLVNSDVVGGAGSSESTRSISNVGVVRSKADLKNYREKSDYISKFGLPAFEALPIK